MKEYDKELYDRYEEEISKITEGINLIREGMEFIISTQKRMNNDWISIDTDLPHPSWKEIEVTTNEGKRKIATYIRKRNVWIDTDFNKIEVIAWKRPSSPYSPTTQNLNKYQKIPYIELLNYPDSFIKSSINFYAKVEDIYWSTSEENNIYSEYSTYYSLALENEITDRRIEVWYDSTKLKSKIFSEDIVSIYGTIYKKNYEELIIIADKVILMI